MGSVTLLKVSFTFSIFQFMSIFNTGSKVDYVRALESEVWQQSIDDTRQKAIGSIQKILGLPADRQWTKIAENPDFAEIQSMLSQGATLEDLLHAARHIEDPSVFFPATTVGSESSK